MYVVQLVSGCRFKLVHGFIINSENTTGTHPLSICQHLLQLVEARLVGLNL